MDIAEPTATVDEGPSHELISSPSAWVGCFSSMRLSPCSRVWWHVQEPHFMPSEVLLLGASLVHWKGATEIKQPQLCLTVVLKFKEETERHKMTGSPRRMRQSQKWMGRETWNQNPHSPWDQKSADLEWLRKKISWCAWLAWTSNKH